MATGYPCPNPSCKQVFPPEAIQGARKLTCPACGTFFRFRNTPAPPSKPVPPPLPPRPAQTPAPNQIIPTPPPLVVAPRQRRPRRGNRGFLKGLLVFLFLSGIAAGTLYYYREDLAEIFDLGPRDAERQAFQKQANFSFRPEAGWRPDVGLRDKLRASVAVTLPKPRSHAALFYRDFAKRAPSDAELLDRALKHLRAYFLNVYYDDPFQGEKNGRTGLLGGEPAIVFPFDATDRDEVPMRGQCYVLTRRGYAYWFVSWGPADNYDELEERWDKLRQGFKLYNEREGWKPTPRKTEPVVGTALPYQLHYASDTWTREPDPKAADTAADLLLRGFEPTRDDDTGKLRDIALVSKSAEVRVLALPKADTLANAVQSTLDHVRKKHLETHPATKIEPVTDRKTGKPLTSIDVGELRGQVDRVKLELSHDHERYARIAVVSLPAGVLAIVCECRWERRDYWDQEFKSLLESVRAAPPADAD